MYIINGIEEGSLFLWYEIYKWKNNPGFYERETSHMGYKISQPTLLQKKKQN